MAAKAPNPVKLHEMTPGQGGDFFALLAEKSRHSTRDQKPYYLCRFRDAKRMASVLIWNDSTLFAECERDWLPSRIYKLRATFSEHEKYGPQLELTRVRPANADDDYDPLEFVERSRFDVNDLFQQLRATTDEIADLPLKQLVAGILDANAEKLKLLPGSIRHYHPFAGGWVEHTLAVTRHARWIGERYRELYPELSPPLNLDLLTAAAALHDIGRLREIDDPLAREPSIEGRLLGHLFLGRDMVRDAARDRPDLDPELGRLLEHLLVSHLNLPEWGSPRLPLIPEALILHHLDDLDAKFEMYARCLTRDGSPGPFTDRDPILNRQLFKGRTV